MESTGWGERSAFAVSGRTFRWTDVACAANAWGQWAECQRAAHAARSALDHANRAGTPLDGPEFEAEQLARRAAAADALGRLGAIAIPLTEPDVAELDLVFMEFCEQSATVDAIEREVEKRRLDGLVLEWRWQTAADTDVLREAALCIRDDGLAFEEVAAQAGLEVQRGRPWGRSWSGSRYAVRWPSRRSRTSSPERRESCNPTAC